LKIIVTGGSGYLGNHVQRFFDADDFSRRSGFDLTNEYDCAKIADYDVVIHLAARLDKSEEAPEECYRVNVQGTENLLRHVRRGAILIFASTKDVYGANADGLNAVDESCSTEYRGQTALEWSKLIAERYVEYYGALRDLRTCIFRLSTVYARPSDGNESGFVTHYVESIKHRQPLRLAGAGEPVRDLLHVDDFSRACSAFIHSPRQTGLYNLGGGRKNSTTLRGIVETIARIVEIEPIIDESAILPAPVPFDYVSDLTRVKSELAWKPTVNIEDGLRSLL
jgi:nucleoside-diphosphate-sugar epimerase